MPRRIKRFEEGNNILQLPLKEEFKQLTPIIIRKRIRDKMRTAVLSEEPKERGRIQQIHPFLLINKRKLKDSDEGELRVFVFNFESFIFISGCINSR